MACPLVPVLPDTAQWLWLGGYFPLLIFLGILSLHYTPRGPSVPGPHSHKDKPRGLFSCPEPLLWLLRQTLLPFLPPSGSTSPAARMEGIDFCRLEPALVRAGCCLCSSFSFPRALFPLQGRGCLARSVLLDCFISLQTSPAWKPAQPSRRAMSRSSVAACATLCHHGLLCKVSPSCPSHLSVLPHHLHAPPCPSFSCCPQTEAFSLLPREGGWSCSFLLQRGERG